MPAFSAIPFCFSKKTFCCSMIFFVMAALLVSSQVFAQTDRAQGKTATASSQEGTLAPANAVDGNSSTRWGSAFSDPQWIKVDCGASYSISRVYLKWETASAKNYTIDVSPDNTAWTTIVTKTNMANGARTDDITGLSATGRYVRMNGTARTTAYGYSLYDFRVYDAANPQPGTLALNASAYSVNENGGSVTITVNRTSGSSGSVSVNYATANGTATAGSDYTAKSGTITFAAGVISQTVSVPILDDAVYEGNETFTITLSNATGGATIGTPASGTVTIVDNETPPATTDLARGKTATASSQEGAYVPANAVDGNATTRWGSAFSDPQWIKIDLGSTQAISSVKLVWEAASAKNYTIDVSNDNTTWSTIATKTNMASGARTDNLTGLSGSGRYIRMNGTARTTAYGYSLFSFEVYGGENTLQTRTDYYAMVLNYDPVLSATYGSKKVTEYFGWNNVDTLIKQYINDLTRASGGQAVWHVAFRWDLNEFPPDADPNVTHTPDNFPSNISSRIGVSGADYAAIAYDSRFGIVSKVEAGQVDAVWVFAPPYTGFYETAMAGNGAFWVNGIVNGINCAKKFVFYGFNYERDIGCMLENTAHLSEQLMTSLAWNWPFKWSYNVWNDFNLRHASRTPVVKYCNDWQRFVLTDQVNYNMGPDGSYCASPGNAQAGSAHFSPNSTHNYGWGGFAEHFDWGPEFWTPVSGTWTSDSTDNGEYHTRSSACAKSFCREDRTPDTADWVFGDFVCEADVRLANESSSSSAGYMFRTGGFTAAANSGTGYYAGINAYSDKVVLARITNGYAELATAPFIAAANTLYHLKIIANGASIKVYASNMATPLISISDASYPYGGFSCAAYNTEAWFDNIDININTKSYAVAWHTYPDLSGTSRTVNFDDWGWSQEGWFCWWFEHIPKNPGLHNDVDITNGTQYTGILNTFWPYIFDINRFDKASGYANVTFVAKDAAAPAAVSAVSAMALNSSKIALGWAEPADNVGVTRYEITRNGTLVQTVWKPTLIDKSLSPSTSYTYTVKARDGSGNVSAAATATAATLASDVAGLLNPGFENGYGNTTPFVWTPVAFTPSASAFKWETAGRSGRCVSVENTVQNDARWEQQITGLVPGKTYRLSCYIKGQNISLNGNTIGATVCLMGAFEYSPTLLYGTFDWTQVSLDFVAPASGTVTVGVRLGFFGSLVTGKAWFDDLTLVQIN